MTTGTGFFILSTLAIVASAQSGSYLDAGIQDVITGNTATLYCPFNFGGTWTWTWTRDNTSIAQNTQIKLKDGKRYTSSRVSDSCQLTISTLQISDNGTYVCRIVENNYYCQVSLIARERAFILDPPPLDPSEGARVIELSSAASSDLLSISCTIRYPANPEVDVLFTETRWKLDLGGSNAFLPSTAVVSALSNKFVNQFTVQRKFTRRDAPNTYSCASYQPLPRNRPSNASAYLAMPADQVDSRDYRLLINGPPYVRATLDYNVALRIVRRRLALFCEPQEGAFASLESDDAVTPGIATETLDATQLNSSQTLYCVVESSPIATGVFEFRSATATQFVNLGQQAVTTKLSSVTALACNANSNSSLDMALCPAFGNLNEDAQAMLNLLLQNYLQVLEVRFSKFDQSHLGTYRCLATSQLGAATHDLRVTSSSTSSGATSAAEQSVQTTRSSPAESVVEVGAAAWSCSPVSLLVLLLVFVQLLAG